MDMLPPANTDNGNPESESPVHFELGEEFMDSFLNNYGTKSDLGDPCVPTKSNSPENAGSPAVVQQKQDPLPSNSEAPQLLVEGGNPPQACVNSVPETIPEPSLSEVEPLQESTPKATPSSDTVRVETETESPLDISLSDQGNGEPQKQDGSVKRRRNREVSSLDGEEYGIGHDDQLGMRMLRKLARIADTITDTKQEDVADGGGVVAAGSIPVNGKESGGATHRSQRGQRGGGKALKKKKQKPVQVDDDVEDRIAMAIGFPVDDLLEEEIEFGVLSGHGHSAANGGERGGAAAAAAEAGGEGPPDEGAYITVRNHILSLWRHNVNQWLEFSEVMATIKQQHRQLAWAAYGFLTQYGYINFGVAPAIIAHIPEQPTKASIIIIGAGLAGLAAARQLVMFGHKVAVIEARHRTGGRVYSKTMATSSHSHQAAADMGGSIITGVQGNPLAVLARQLGLALHNIRSSCPLYSPDGTLVPQDLDDRVETAHNWMLDQASSVRVQIADMAEHISLGTTLETLRDQAGLAALPEERRLLEWHQANLEFANAALLADLSLAHWDQDDVYEMSGDHCFTAGSNGAIVDALSQGLPLFTGLCVTQVRYGPQGVRVSAQRVPPSGAPSGDTAEQVFEGDMVLCTLPLGVLKKQTITFDPPLPVRKQEAIERLGFGLLNKVAMLFPYAFWGDEVDMFGHVGSKPSERGEFFLFYNNAAVAGGALLMGLVAGEAAHSFEETPSQVIVNRVMDVLRGIFEGKGVRVPHPMVTQCTRWKADPYSSGSYSYVKVGASGDDYDVMAASVNGRLFFAGEATCKRYPATMHGAFLSGLWVAGKIAEMAEERSGLSSHRPRQKLSMQQSAAALDEIFQQPDLEFGMFQVVFDPRDKRSDSFCLLKVVARGGGEAGETGLSCRKQSSKPPPAIPPAGAHNYFSNMLQREVLSLPLPQDKNHSSPLRGGPDGRAAIEGEAASEVVVAGRAKRGLDGRQGSASLRSLQLYAVLTRKGAEELREVRGGNHVRLMYLTEHLGVKLLGRRGLGAVGDELIEVVKRHRSSTLKTRKR